MNAATADEPARINVAGGDRPAITTPTDSIELVPRFTIGELDGAPAYAFGQVVSVLPRSDGGFYACDRNDTSVRLYDSAGVFITNIGRKGSGPGEYTDCWTLSLVGDSLLWVADRYNGRFVAFALDGRAVTTLKHSRLSDPRYVDSQGRFWWATYIRDKYEVGVERYRLESSDLGGGGGFSIEVPAHRVPQPDLGFAISTTEGNYLSHDPDTVWNVAPDGAMLIATTRDYRVTRVEHGRPTLTFAPTVLPAPVGYEPAERAEYDQWSAYFESTGFGEGRKFLRVGERKAFVRSIRGDDVGRIWVQVHVRAEKRPIPPRPPGNRKPLLTWRERNTFDLFDGATGLHLGRVAFPYATELMATSGDRVWLTDEGPDGEQRIAVHDLRAFTTPRK